MYSLTPWTTAVEKVILMKLSIRDFLLQAVNLIGCKLTNGDFGTRIRSLGNFLLQMEVNALRCYINYNQCDRLVLDLENEL